MKRVLLMFMLVGLLVVQVQADLVTSGGNLYADADASTTTFADGSSPWSTTTGGAVANLWWERSGYGYNTAGQLGGSTFEALTDETHWRPTGDVDGLKTTVSGLVDGVDYNVYVIYGSKSLGENWNVTADFSVIATDPTTGVVQSGLTYGAAAAELQGVNVLAGVQIEEIAAGSGIYAFKGLIGTVTGDAGGMLDVYIDDLSNTTGDNDRAWYDGVYVEVVPEPATMLLLGLGAVLMRKKR